ncbi:MAG: hypothetical protein IKV23_03080 [Bacteroidaceae bacterium]|nr:hypothetical protein [Bacteroidaceae bacterium]
MNIVLLLSALLLTIAIEWIVLRVMGEKSRKILLYSMLINAATNLPLNIFAAQAALSTQLMAEAIIIAIEAALYYTAIKEIRKSLVYSTLCNVTSFLTGVLIELTILLTL